MKKRIFAIIILASLTLTGCGSSKPNEELDKITNEIKVNETGSIVNPTNAPTEEPKTDGTEVPAEETVTPDATVDSAAGNTTSGANGEEAAADESTEEKYYVTFEANTVDGEPWNSDNLANSRLTMINVWATYCNPCLSEMPDLGELAAEYDAAEFQIIGVVSDVMEGDSADNIEYAKELITETKADYPHLLLNESLYMSFVGAISAVPTTFFVRQDGSMVGYLTGAMDKENWKMLIDDLLAQEQ